MIMNRMTGPYAPIYWILILCNIVDSAHHFVVFQNPPERGRAVCDLPDRPDGHVAGALRYCGHQPAPRFSALLVGNVLPDQWDWAVFVGTIGLFFTLFLLFIRFLPMISIFEMRGLAHELKEKAGARKALRRIELKLGRLHARKSAMKKHRFTA